MRSPGSWLNVTMERDSVCAGDDVHAPHPKTISTPPDCTLAQILDTIHNERYLPRISGDCATWIVESQRPLAVMAQQWSAPRFLIAPETRLVDCAELERPCTLFFRYWCQIDPAVVFDCLVAGRPLPDMYGRA